MHYQDWIVQRGDVCKICDDWRRGTFGGQERYCLCSMLEWLDEQKDRNNSYQSPFNNVILSQLEPLHNPPDEADLRLQKTVNFINDRWLSAMDRWMFIYGGTGSAKTHILNAIRTYLPAGLSIYITAGDFRAKLFNAQSVDGEVDRMTEALSTTPILLYDDWGMEYQKLNDWAGATFENILDRRSTHPDYFPTIVTSNRSEESFRGSTDKSQVRAISRLCDPQYSIIVEFLQADFRDRLVQESIK